jgi:ketosteroid isomerase-like protein
MKSTLVRGIVIGLTALVLPACAPETDEEILDLDSRAEALQTLREADRSWARSAPDVEAFMSHIAADVVWLFCSLSPMTGKNEVNSWALATFAIPGFSLTWAPTIIDVSASGDMGYTFGSWLATRQDSSGHLVEATGPYATVWRRPNGGDWEVVLEADYPPVSE